MQRTHFNATGRSLDVTPGPATRSCTVMSIIYHIFCLVSWPITPPYLGIGSLKSEPNTCPQHAKCDHQPVQPHQRPAVRSGRRLIQGNTETEEGACRVTAPALPARRRWCGCPASDTRREPGSVHPRLQELGSGLRELWVRIPAPLISYMVLDPC